MTSEPLVRTWRPDPPVSMPQTLKLLRHGGADPCHRTLPDGTTWRTSRLPTGSVTMLLRQRGPEIELTAWGDGADEACSSLPDLLGARDDVSGFVAHHGVVADAFRRFRGLRFPATGRVLESLVPAVIEQKVVGQDAFAGWRRLVSRFGDPAPGPAPDGMRLAPTGEGWAALPSWEWHRAGVDPSRARAAQAAARLADRLERLATTGDPGDLYAGLRSIPGIGVWTAAETGYRVLADADAVPFGDYHLGTTVGVPLAGRALDDVEVAEVLEPYRPHRFRVVRLLEMSPLATVPRRGPRMPRVDHRSI